jgi:hypothetical protein
LCQTDRLETIYSYGKKEEFPILDFGFPECDEQTSLLVVR